MKTTIKQMAFHIKYKLIGFHILYSNLEQWFPIEHGNSIQILHNLMEVEKYLQSTFKQLFFITVITIYISVTVSAENAVIKGSRKQTAMCPAHQHSYPNCQIQHGDK